MKLTREQYLKDVSFSVSRTTNPDKPFNVQVYKAGRQLVGDFYPTAEEGLAEMISIIDKTLDEAINRVEAFTWDQAVALVENAK